jgi:hypothetical protein
VGPPAAPQIGWVGSGSGGESLALHAQPLKI